MAPKGREREEPERNLAVRDFQPLLCDMAALGMGVGPASRRLLFWRAAIWALLLTYVVLWIVRRSGQRFIVNVHLVNDLVSALAAFSVQIQFQKYSEGLGVVLRGLGPRRLQGPLRALVLLAAFVPWAAQSAMTATYLLRSGTTGVAETLLRYVLVKNHIWLGAALITCFSLAISARLNHLNSVLFLEGPLSPRAVDGARQAHGLLCSMVAVLDNALGPVLFFWQLVFVVDIVSLTMEAFHRSSLSTSLVVLNSGLLVLLWTLSCEACTRLRMNALYTVDTLAYKLSEQPELNLPGALACAAARQQDLGISCWGIVMMGRPLALSIAAFAAGGAGMIIYLSPGNVVE